MTDTVPVDPDRAAAQLRAAVEVSTDAKTPGGGVHRRLPAL